MAQQGEINQNQSIQGLFTEGNPLNFPEGATVRDENFVLKADGTRERRLGLGEEPEAVNNNTDDITGATYTFDWDAVGNDGNKNYAAVYNGNEMHFYDKAIEPLSAGYKGSFWGPADQVSATAVNGDLIVVGMRGGEVKRFYEEDGEIQYQDYVITVRDIWGIDDPLRVDERPSNLSDAHAYNLANQGWKLSQARLVRDVGVSTQTVTNPDTGEDEVVVTDEGGWPSNADLVVYGISDTDPNNGFTAGLYRQVPFGNTPSPKGAAKTQLTSMIRGRIDHMGDQDFGAYIDAVLYLDDVKEGPKAVASYAGRVFYAGFIKEGNRVNSTYPNLTSTIVFSRSIESPDDIVECYQMMDPTSIDAEVLASDGGSLTITGTGFIYKMVPVGRSLLIFASEGVWELYSTDQLFSANNYQIRKLTDVGCKSTRSIIVVESIPMYWTDYGIYALQPDQVSESFVATNITAGTIQSYYDEIDAIAVRNAFGFYDKFDKKARWLYSTNEDPLEYDRELVFDSRLKSWYTNVYPTVAGKQLGGMVSLNAFSEVISFSNILVGSSQVVVGEDDVITGSVLADRGKRSYKYVVKDFDLLDHRFYEYNRADFKDYGLQDAQALMITGPYTGGDSVRRKSSTYLTMQLSKTETGFLTQNGDIVPVNPGSCMVETRWDWTDLSKAGKFNFPIEMYRHRRHYFPETASDNYEDGNTVLTTKSRLRGSGRSLALKIYSTPEKDLRLLGWNIQINQNQKV